MSATNSLLPRVGQRVEAAREISWTLNEFDDYPLIVEPGDKGIVTEADEESNRVCVEWDKDEFKHMEKCLSLETEPDRWSLRVVE